MYKNSMQMIKSKKAGHYNIWQIRNEQDKEMTGFRRMAEILSHII